MTRSIIVALAVAVLGRTQDVESIASMIQGGKYAEARELAMVRLQTERSPGEKARLLYLSGTAANVLGHFAEAQKALNSAVEICETLQNEEVLMAEILVSIGSTVVELGAPAEAERPLLRARRLIDQVTRVDYPYHATIAGALGYVYWNSSQLTKAEAEDGRAAAVAEKAFGSGNYITARHLSSLGTFLAGTGRGAEAIPLMERCVPTLQGQFGSTHHETIRALHGLGMAKSKEDTRGAEALLQLALKQWLAAYPEMHPSTAYLRQAIGESRFAQNDAKGAVEPMRRAIAIARVFYESSSR